MFNNLVVTRPRKQERCQPVFPSLRHDKVGPVLFAVADFISKDFAASEGARIRVKRCLLKAAFIKVNQVLCAILREQLAQCFEILSSFGIRPLQITGLFFL